GEIAGRLSDYASRVGGLLTKSDLLAYRAQWQEPIGLDDRGHRILECPPNGQGVAALIALKAISAIDFGTFDRDSPDCWHLLIEAMKQGMIAAHNHVADLRYSDDPVEMLLASALTPSGWIASSPGSKAWGCCDTVYLATTDDEGNAVSFINSVYGNFGSGH